MKRLSAAFKTGRKALAVYLPAGFPRPGADERIALAAIEAGADILELGFPFSDPIADGPVIQEATRRALDQGMTLAGAIDLAARVRRRTMAPIILMGYANPVLAMGFDRFAERAGAAGVDGAIVPDLPMEEASGLLASMRAKGLCLIPMAAPNTPPDRLARIMESGDGFLYLVSMAGITGDPFHPDAPWRQVAAEARRLARLPVCVGFGIRTGKDAAAAARWADGVVVGSAVVEAVLSAPDDESAVGRVQDLVRELATAIKARSL